MIAVMNAVDSYQGVDRLPVYPSQHKDESSALNAYVFGDYKSSETSQRINGERKIDANSGFLVVGSQLAGKAKSPRLKQEAGSFVGFVEIGKHGKSHSACVAFVT